MTSEEITARQSSLAVKIQQRRDDRDARRQATAATDLSRRELQTLDSETRRAITSGFAVDGKTFSSSDSAQLKWLHLYTARDIVQYPLRVPNIDNTEFVELVDAAAVTTYYTALVNHIQSHYTLNVAEKKARRQR